MTVTLLTYADAPDGIFFCTDFASKFVTVTVVEELRKALCMVYLGVKGLRMRSSDVLGTIIYISMKSLFIN